MPVLEPDLDAIPKVKLDEVALWVATQAAYDACHAGLEPAEELSRAIQGYVWAIRQLRECAKPATVATHEGI